jgi:hypothetical protein
MFVAGFRGREPGCEQPVCGVEALNCPSELPWALSVFVVGNARILLSGSSFPLCLDALVIMLAASWCPCARVCHAHVHASRGCSSQQGDVTDRPQRLTADSDGTAAAYPACQSSMPNRQQAAAGMHATRWARARSAAACMCAARRCCRHGPEKEASKHRRWLLQMDGHAPSSRRWQTVKTRPCHGAQQGTPPAVQIEVGGCHLRT